MTAPISVDPSALASIGTTVGGEGDGISAAIGSIDSGLSGARAMFGHDAAGVIFAQSYTASGKALLDAAGSAVNACRRVGFGVQVSAANYGRANASSTVGGGTSPVPVPTPPGQFSAPGMPPPFGDGIAAPVGWALVEAFVGDVWPDGNPGELRAAAGAWRSFATTVSGLAGQVTSTGPGLSAQQIPEAAQMAQALGQVGGGLTDIGSQAQTLATAVDGFADAVETTQNAVRGLLDQLSLSGVLDMIGGIFTGENPLDKVREVAHEIKVVLDNMKREAEASSHIFSQGINMLDSATNSLEKWARREFTDALGQDVGGALSFAFTATADRTEGALKFVASTVQGVRQLDPTRFAYDPSGAAKTWEAMGESAAVMTNPALLASKVVEDPSGSLDTLKDVVDWNDVEAGHPFRALGYNEAQIATALIPGAGEAEPAIEGAQVAGRVASAEERAAAGATRDVAPGVAGASSASDTIASQAGRVSSDLNAIKVPESTTPGAAPGASTPAGRPPVDGPATPGGRAPVDSAPGGRATVETAPPADTPGGHAPVDAPPDEGPRTLGPEVTKPHASELVSPVPTDETVTRGVEHAPPQDAPPPAPNISEPAQIPESNPSPSSGGGEQGSGPSASEPSAPMADASPSRAGDSGNDPSAARADGGYESPHHDPEASEGPAHEGGADSNGGPDTDDRHQESDTPHDPPQNIPHQDIPPLLTRESPYEVGSIQSQYVGEQYPNGYFEHLNPNGVTYLDDVARQELRVFLRDGHLYDARGNLFDTSDGVSAFGPGSSGRAIFVMDENGNLFASTEHRAAYFHHSSFFAGRDVAAAGELVAKDGRIEMITDRSGHYMPGRSRTMQMLNQLASQGIDLSQTVVDIFAPLGS